MSGHTKEPWEIKQIYASGQGGISDFIIGRITGADGRDVLIKDENAERIVACVNYCAGMGNDQMENNKATAVFYVMQQRIDQLQRENAELLKQIEAYDRYIHVGRQNTIVACPECPKMIAIASAEGKV